MGGNWSDSQIQRMSMKDKEGHFRDRFYAHPRTFREMYRDIQHPDLGERCIKKPNARDFLSAFYFLKVYPTEKSLAGFNGCSNKHGLVKAWKYLRAIQALKGKKIKWIFDEEPYSDLNEFFFLTVDGVHCKIYEPRFMPSSGWYSQKFNKAGLSYEVGMAIYHDKVCWVNGPFPAGQNDLRIFRKENGLLSKIPDNKRVIADEGYVGEPAKVATRNEFDSAEVVDLKRRAKARQESINSKLKAFNILQNTFRTTGEQRLEKHQTAFESCLVVIQYELDNGSRKLMKV
eukprot:scaffold15422_cov39-Cylindrotheca_fusiformis.AAC.1